MSWLDKLLGREKKSDEMSGESSMKSEDMNQGQSDMGTQPSAPEQPAQEGQESPPGAG